MSERLITAIDERGDVYPVGKLEAHRRALPHLAISVFVFRGGQTLLQRRAPGKYHSPGQWANACCSHPDWQEAIATCAARRLREEMGLELPLTPAAVMDYRAEVGGGLVENERVHFFAADWPTPAPTVAPDPEEVDAYRWVDVTTLREEVAMNPDAFTPWLRIYLARAGETGIERLRASV
ncbi:MULTISPECIES: isopentenyl-diphosphate Delta-isomerase [unclassified Modicisalibacter]|uniref:isopentenyl-diphosphate Delta-isomerase n=1 Tax=unclassified Modicisalibacter TaxID=2679913 RepID=UPI001CCE54FD|nr:MULTISPECIES: isopentenyl-diphosphate Delta-isomerase [unclassified Modicisalibacter]MBZ9560486.1 isopentenyl-diphosphate Delta-isomerase [Modicisalibacter sp. R2A 31.J]MBZ9575110.1 isopentenyl-diphosphate Delta-isomerase [Modicisalibacter sp. MOD 31.J]